MVISEFQSAFVPSRLISDIVAFESHHYIKHRSTSPNALMSDISIAFDRVEWNFVVAILKAMNFPNYLVGLIQKCISTVHFSFMPNGSSFWALEPQWGVRQGDPFSPTYSLFALKFFQSSYRTRRCANVFLGCRLRGVLLPSLTFFPPMIPFFLSMHHWGGHLLKACYHSIWKCI